MLLFWDIFGAHKRDTAWCGPVALTDTHVVSFDLTPRFSLWCVSCVFDLALDQILTWSPAACIKTIHGEDYREAEPWTQADALAALARHVLDCKTRADAVICQVLTVVTTAFIVRLEVCHLSLFLYLIFFILFLCLSFLSFSFLSFVSLSFLS